MLANAPFPMEPLLGFGWIAIFLIIGLWLRAKVPLFRRYLIPACLLGGTAGFLCNTFGLLNATGLGVSNKTLEVIAYHMFNMTWVLLGLQKAPEDQLATSKRAVKGPLWMTGIVLTVSTICVTAVLLLGLVMKKFGYEGPASLGLLVCTGFAAGPGQTMTIASVWEKATQATGYVSFGLAGASTGYLVAMIVGVPLMNIICRRYKMTTFSAASLEEQRGYYGTSPKPSAGSQTMVTTAMETLSWHLGLGIATYVAVLFVYGLLGQVLPPKAMHLLWALLFLAAMMAGMLVRKAMTAMKIDHLVCRNLTNRVNGFMVDFLVCATFISIQVGAVKLNLTSFVLSCLIVTFLTGIIMWLTCRNVSAYGVETFGMLFGTLTGTISTGLVLMRMVDPDCKTPVVKDYGISMLFLLPFSVPSMVMTNWEIVLNRSPWTMVAFYAAWAAAGIICILLTKPGKFTGGETGASSSCVSLETT